MFIYEENTLNIEDIKKIREGVQWRMLTDHQLQQALDMTVYSIVVKCCVGFILISCKFPFQRILQVMFHAVIGISQSAVQSLLSICKIIIFYNS